MTNPPPRLPRHPRPVLALVVVFLVAATGAACGEDEPDVVAPPVDLEPEETAPVEPSLIGLEVTAAGNVTEVVSPIAFRIDKDGIDGEVAETEFDDEDFGDVDLAREGVLVLDVEETEVTPGVPVQVTGTFREFDLPVAERIFDFELDPSIFGRFRDVLVIVADKVVEQPGVQNKGTTTTTSVVEQELGPAASVVGLEVTATGNVTDVVGPMAFQLDKDGIGDEAGEVRFDDEVFDDVELARRPVLVVDATKATRLDEGSAVRVSGTIREFDADDVERLFAVDLDDRIYGPFDDKLVIVAHEVAKVAPPEGSRAATTKP